MALITCSVCGKQFSDRVENCPQCGSTAIANTQVKKAICIAALALIISCMLFVVYSILKYFQYDESYYFMNGYWTNFSWIWYYANLVLSLLIIICFFGLQMKNSLQKSLYRRITSSGLMFSLLSVILLLLCLFSSESFRYILCIFTLLIGLTTVYYGIKLAEPSKYLGIVAGIVIIGVLLYSWKEITADSGPAYSFFYDVIFRKYLLSFVIVTYMSFVVMLYRCSLSINH